MTKTCKDREFDKIGKQMDTIFFKVSGVSLQQQYSLKKNIKGSHYCRCNILNSTLKSKV